MAATCDVLLGQEEVVEKSLGPLLASLSAYLGAAILGRRRGDSVSYVAPNGRSINVTVVKVEPFGG